jgi:hypothetical protein
MQRHTGGVQGTVLWRGYCPVCLRGVAGGNCSRPPGKQICLRPHKTVTGESGMRDWCKGGRSIVPPSHELMDEWAAKLRVRAERRCSR